MTDLAATPLWHYRYRLTRADVAAFQSLRRDGLAPLLLAVVVVGALVGWHFEWLEPQLPFDAGGAARQTMLGLVVAGLGSVVAWGMNWLRRLWRTARHPLPASEMVVDVFGDHIAWSCDGRADLRAWERVGDIIATPDHVFVFTAPGEALIMPLRAFDNAVDMAAFADWAEENIEAIVKMLSGKYNEQ